MYLYVKGRGVRYTINRYVTIKAKDLGKRVKGLKKGEESDYYRR